MCAFFYISIQIIFAFFLQIVKHQTEKTCKIGYNWIIYREKFLRNGWKEVLKGAKWSSMVRVKKLFSDVSNLCFLLGKCLGTLNISKEALL